MRIKLRTLSPLHIGTGEELAPLDYVAYNKTFYRIPQERFFEFLQQTPEGPLQFSTWINDKFDEMKDIRDNRALALLEQQMNTLLFARSINQGDSYLQFLKGTSSGIFQAPIVLEKRIKSISKDQKLISLGRVREHVKNDKKRPYLPGSSLKGAIRTAIFYHYLVNEADDRDVEQTLRKQLHDRRVRRERFANPLIEKAFYCGVKNKYKEGARIKTNDEKMDLFKLVQVRDAHFSEDDRLQLAKINLYLVEKQKANHQQRRAEFKAVQQPQTSYCEAIKVDSISETELDFNIEFLLTIKPLIRQGGVPAGDFLQWIGIKEKVKILFGLDIDELNAGNKEEKRLEVIQFLIQKLKAFSQAQLSASKDWLEHFSKNDKSQELSRKIGGGFSSVYHFEDQNLMHLGYSTGFDGMTGLLYFLENSNRKALFKDIMGRFNIGNKPGNRGKYLPNPDRFPKSKRLIESREGIQPMGWIQLLGIDEVPEEIPSAAYQKVTYTSAEPKVEKGPVKAEYYKGKINPKKPPELDAVVVKSGRPNQIQVYIAEDNMPTIELQGYRQPLEEGMILKVSTVFNRRGDLVQASYRKKK